MTLSESVEFDERDRKQFVFHETTLRRFIRWGLEQSFRLIMKLEVRGVENIPLDDALIVACNHNTNWDVIPMQLSLPRVIFFMGKAELFKFFVIDYVFRSAGAFPVYRGEKDAWAMRHAQGSGSRTDPRHVPGGSSLERGGVDSSQDRHGTPSAGSELPHSADGDHGQ